MSGLVYPQEREVVDRFERALLHAINRVRRQILRREPRLSGEINRIGHLVVAQPVADPVGIAGPYDDIDAGLDHVGESGQERARVYVVSCALLGKKERTYYLLFAKTCCTVRLDIPGISYARQWL